MQQTPRFNNKIFDFFEHVYFQVNASKERSTVQLLADWYDDETCIKSNTTHPQ